MKVSDLTKKPPDRRLKSERFRQAIRDVLEDIGVENKMSNFRLYDRWINWFEYARLLKHPIRTAVVKIRGFPNVKLGIDFPGGTKTEAVKKLDKRKYDFVEWF